jgi:hypothetical protein
LLHAARIQPAEVSICYLYGVAFDLRAVGALQLDLPVGQPPQGADPSIVVHVAAPALSNPQPLGAPQMQVAPQVYSNVGPEMARAYDDIDVDWNEALKLEKQLVLERKKLSGMLTRLGTLDRDLTPDERLYGDRQAKADWQEARRGLKETAARLARYIKEHDIGETSAAGKRLALQQTFEQIIALRRPVDNIAELQRDFDAYRKRLQVLLQNMNKAYNGATQDGERRAQEVLRRLNASVRSAATVQKRGRTESLSKLKPK